MKKRSVIVMMFLGLLLMTAGCVAKKPVVVSTPAPDPCPMPEGYILEPAIDQAETALMNCPNRLDSVFQRLLDISKHNPKPENALLIQDLLKRMVSANKISKSYSKDLYRKYFSVHFAVPDVKVYNLAEEIDTLKRDLRRELTLKKEGLVECCNNKEEYKKAESEYARLVVFMDSLVLNEQYLREPM